MVIMKEGFQSAATVVAVEAICTMTPQHSLLERHSTAGSYSQTI